ncbi:MAG: hypothetical protein NVSMB51_12740 [Solirubrobacteraceae bacterium]
MRRTLLARVVSLAFLVLNRRDYEQAARFIYEPDADLRLHGYDAVGFPDRYSGRSGLLAFLNDWERVMGLSTWRPLEIIDLGERILVHAQFTGTGRISGASAVGTAGYLFHLAPSGRTAAQDFYWDWHAAVEAAELRR